MMPEGKYMYYLGLDLGQSQDYTALCIIEEQLFVSPSWSSYVLFPNDQVIEGWVSPARLSPEQAGVALGQQDWFGRPADVPLQVRHLERFPLGTKYTDIVARVSMLARSEPLRSLPAVLLVDKTGVGAPVLDHFEQGGIRAVAVTIHGGSSITRDPRRLGYRVPKRDLVSAAQVLLQNGRLKVASALPEAETLKKELLNFRVKVNAKTAHDSYEHWREGDHDDLVLAVAQAVWFRQYWNRHVDGELERRLRHTDTQMTSTWQRRRLSMKGAS